MAGAKKRSGTALTLNVTLEPKDLAILRRRAKRLYGGDVSAAIGDAVELLRIDEGRSKLAATLEYELGPLEPALARSVLMETFGLIPPLRRRPGEDAVSALDNQSEG